MLASIKKNKTESLALKSKQAVINLVSDIIDQLAGYLINLINKHKSMHGTKREHFEDSLNTLRTDNFSAEYSGWTPQIHQHGNCLRTPINVYVHCSCLYEIHANCRARRAIVGEVGPLAVSLVMAFKKCDKLFRGLSGDAG